MEALRYIRRAARLALIVPLLLSACTAAPRGAAKPLSAQAAIAILHRYDFPEVRHLGRLGDGWEASAWRDGVWLPVEVLDNGTLLVQQYPRDLG